LIQARRRGIVVKQIDLPQPLTGPEQALGLFAGAVTDRTRALVFSHVQYGDGATLPVRELCQFARQRNLLSIVDGAQAFGMLDFNLRDLDCDFYATCFHKWLGGSQGSGMLYIRREMLERVWPAQPRHFDSSPAQSWPAAAAGQQDVPAALRHFGNTVPYLWPALKGGEAALDLQQRIGRTRIEARVRELAIYARLRLQQAKGVQLITPARPGLWAGILTFSVAGRPALDVAAQLAKGRRVFVRAIETPVAPQGALRLSMHLFNSHDDVDRLVQGLA
jgi:selenocysteine lyase/cysteine desulfurase